MTSGLRLPAFIIGGAAKAATTWVAHQLRQHPDVCLPGPEPHYFSRNFDRGTAWYADCFAEAGDNQLIGEKSADYLACEEAPQRIAALLPDVRIIMQLRNPVDRAYSHYCMFYRHGRVGSDLETYLTGSGGDEPRFLLAGLYSVHLARFFDHFPAEQIKILLYEDIKTRPEALMRDVCAHIGVPARIDTGAVHTRKNSGDAQFLPRPLRRLLQPMKGVVAPVRSRPWFQAVHRRLAGPVAYPPLTSPLRQRLTDHYARDVSELGKMLNQDLSGWLGGGGNDRAAM